jgi:hypothetical protein
MGRPPYRVAAPAGPGGVRHGPTERRGGIPRAGAGARASDAPAAPGPRLAGLLPTSRLATSGTFADFWTEKYLEGTQRITDR